MDIAVSELWSLLTSNLPLLVAVAGWGQILLILGSLGIPVVLGWKEKLSGLTTLIRQMFWVYSFYIWCTNLCFGLLSALERPSTELSGRYTPLCIISVKGRFQRFPQNSLKEYDTRGAGNKT